MAIPSSLLIELRDVTSTGVVVGKGAYGRVIEVCVHGTLCAAKEVHPILVEGVSPAECESTKRKFITECIFTTRAHHPNVVQVLGIHYPTPEAKLPWLVMEMMETSLTKFMEQDHNVPHHIKLSILVDISQGLEFLHGQDIIHRDLSSNNVLLSKHCLAKIADLGVAKAIGHNPAPKAHTQMPGTLQFMPPETMSVEPCYGKPVDVFSLACITLHVMSHQWPQPKDLLQDNSLTARTEVQRREDYLELCTPSSLRLLVESCLHNEPGERPKISAVCKEMRTLKTSNNRQKPLAAASYIELLNLIEKANKKSNHMEAVVRERDQQIEDRDQQILELTSKLYETKTEDYTSTSVISHDVLSGEDLAKETRSDTFSYTRLSSITEDSSPKNSTRHFDNPISLEDPSSSVVTSLPLQGSKRPGRPRSYALSTPDADHIANAITISGSNDNRGFNVSLNTSNRRLSESRDKGLTKSLPDLPSLKVATSDNPAPVTQSQQKPVKKRWTLFGKKRSLSYIPDDDRFDLWQCAGCQHLTESDKLKCKGCGGYAGSKAIAESLCKCCKVKVFLPADYERLRSDSSCPMCYMALGNTRLITSTSSAKTNKK